MTKILLINPSEKDVLKKAGDRPPLGILYLASALLKHCHEVKIMDMNHEEERELMKIIKDYELIGMTFTTSMYYEAIRLAKKIREKSKNYLIAGGPHPSADPESCFKHFNYVIVGEGEEVVVEIANRKLKRRGIIYTPLIKDLDTIPFPARHLIDMNRYNLKQGGRKTATLITSRGCKGGCVYCSRKAMGDKFRAHSPKYVIKELKELRHKYNYKSFYFLDDTFTHNKERVIRICKLIKKHLPKISFRITTRADKTDFKMLRELKSAGLKILSLGIEHADNKVLRKSGKGMTIEQNEKVIKWCHKLGIKVKGFFIINLPGATIKTVEKTVSWAIENKLDDADFYTLTALPGSCIWGNYRKLGMRLLDIKYRYFQATNDNNFNINIDSEIFPKNKVFEMMDYCKMKWRRYKSKKSYAVT